MCPLRSYPSFPCLCLSPSFPKSLLRAFLLTCFVDHGWKVKVKDTQLSPTLCDPMGYTVHGILQARILEWVAFPSSRGIFSTQGSNPGLPHCRWILYQLSHKGSPRILEWIAYPFSSGSSQPRNWTKVSYLAGRFFTNWAIREARVCQKKTGPTLSPPERW